MSSYCGHSGGGGSKLKDKSYKSAFMGMFHSVLIVMAWCICLYKYISVCFCYCYCTNSLTVFSESLPSLQTYVMTCNKGSLAGSSPNSLNILVFEDHEYRSYLLLTFHSWTEAVLQTTLVMPSFCHRVSQR